MPTIFIKDELRASVEAVSGGRVTVLYDDKGYPSYMHVFPRFNVQDIDVSLGTGTHEAFIVNGIEKAEIFIGQHVASVRDSRAVSLPGMAPHGYVSFDAAHTYCTNKGPGWHLMTNAEWSAVALWAWRNGFQPRGNTDYGRAHDLKYETGRRVDKGSPGVTSGSPQTLTGSGPESWRHNNSVSGISDLVGNVWEWVGGFRLNDGEIQVLPNNDAADGTKDQGAASSLWKAILASDGSLVNPGTEGTLKYDSVNAGTSGNVGPPRLNDAVINSNAPDGYIVEAFQALTVASPIVIPNILKRLALYPIASSDLSGSLYLLNYGERLPIRGGYRTYGFSNAGLFALSVNYTRSYASSNIGFRPAFVI